MGLVLLELLKGGKDLVTNDNFIAHDLWNIWDTQITKDLKYVITVNDTKDFTPKRIVQNGSATIVFWKDNTKTVVKCAEGTEPDAYTAFTAALAKKIFGNNSRIKKIVKKTENQGEKKK